MPIGKGQNIGLGETFDFDNHECCVNRPKPPISLHPSAAAPRCNIMTAMGMSRWVSRKYPRYQVHFRFRPGNDALPAPRSQAANLFTPGRFANSQVAIFPVGPRPSARFRGLHAQLPTFVGCRSACADLCLAEPPPAFLARLQIVFVPTCLIKDACTFNAFLELA
jgi:hypothetical protein